jgi:hypothetical protein
MRDEILDEYRDAMSKVDFNDIDEVNRLKNLAQTKIDIFDKEVMDPEV